MEDSKQEHCHSQLRVLVWTLIGAVVFAFSWCITGGGYLCSLPVFMMCTLYCCSSDCCMKNLRFTFCISWMWSVKENCKIVLKEDRRASALILGYFVVKFLLMLIYPSAEKSNGSPMSLILFTVFFILIYLIPSILRTIFRFIATLRNSHKIAVKGEWLEQAFRTLVSWRKSLLVIILIVLSTYLLDGEISAMLRFFGAGKPCWPLLIQNNVQNTGKLPANLLSTVQWQLWWKDYRPHWILHLFIAYGRELGEVCQLLPVLIGNFILAQLLLPSKFFHIKRSLFACIAGVVLGGVTSGLFKILFHRYRPNAYGNPYMWTGPGMTTVNHLQFSKLDLSFPAGHTTVTTAVATCLYVFITSNIAEVKLSRIVGVLLMLSLYIHPVVVLLSRVSDCCHWTSDASFGIFLGYVVGILVSTNVDPTAKVADRQRSRTILPV